MDFRLKVFISVANNLNFTKSSRELCISQPAVSRHIQELESEYGVQLFVRTGSRVELTTSGEIFLKHAESIIESYRAMSLDMNLQSGNFSGTLHIGASTTIAQYVIPEKIAKFIKRFPDIRLTMFTGNSQQIEQALIDHKIDIGIVESNSKHTGLKYSRMADDELVLVTSSKNRIKEEISIEELIQLPMVLREIGSGTLDVIEDTLQKHNIKLSQINTLIRLGSTEGIKLFLENCPSAYALISINALTKELLSGNLKIIEIDGMRISRQFSLVTVHGASNDIADRFMTFARDNI